MKTFRKQPRDHLDYMIDLSAWLSPDDEIEAVEANAEDGIEITRRSIEPKQARLWIRGGTSGETYRVTVLVHTESRIKEVEFLIIVVDT